MATDKQIGYIMSLLPKTELSTQWMNSSWKGFASMRERSGKVEDFVAGLNAARASELIDYLKSKIAED
jgi:hypothetical protein